MCNRVAVYGTLKSGFRANHKLASAKRLGYGVTVPRFRMTDVGFPMLEFNDEGHQVLVEVYENPHWRVLDMYEGVPHLYTREVITVKLDNGETVDAYVYVAQDARGAEVLPDEKGILQWPGQCAEETRCYR